MTTSRMSNITDVFTEGTIGYVSYGRSYPAHWIHNHRKGDSVFYKGKEFTVETDEDRFALAYIIAEGIGKPIINVLSPKHIKVAQDILLNRGFI